MLGADPVCDSTNRCRRDYDRCPPSDTPHAAGKRVAPRHDFGRFWKNQPGFSEPIIDLSGYSRLNSSMEPLTSRFDQAIAAVKGGGAGLSDGEKLVLYGLFKQAHFGDVDSKRPGFFDWTGRAKW